MALVIIGLPSNDQRRLSSSARILVARASTVALAVLYAVILQIVYVKVVSPAFSYMGYTARELLLTQLLTVNALTVAPAFWMPIRLTRPSQLMLWIIYLVAYVPGVLIPVYALDTPPERLLIFSLSLLASMAVFGLIYALPLLEVRTFFLNRALFWLAVATAGTAALLVVIQAFGLPKQLPQLDEIYEVREGYSMLISSGGRLINFSVALLANVLAPLLIAVGCISRRWWLFLAGVGVELMVFAITGFKSALLASFAIVIMFMVVKTHGRRLGPVILLGGSLLVLLSVLVDALISRMLFVSWLVRRFLVTPGLAAGRFFEYFSANEFALLGHSILSPFVTTPYVLTPPYLVGKAYEGRLFSANANFWADGFANFGVVGIILATIVIALIAYLFDSIANRRSAAQRTIITLLLVLPAITFSNSAALTSLLTHGVGLLLLLVWLMPLGLINPRHRRRMHISGHPEERKMLRKPG